MSSVHTSEATKIRVARPGGGASHLDFVLSSVFLSAAALILVAENPINLDFKPLMLESLVVVFVGIALLLAANLLRHTPLLMLGSGVLLFAVAASTGSQPSQVNQPIVAIWPLRIGIVLLVAFAWGFLLQPPGWMRRALAALAVPTIVLLGVFLVPAVAAQVFRIGTYRPFNNKFAPYWIVVNSSGGLLASDLEGRYIFTFDSSGTPQGTLNPALAPAVHTPGPGIVPNGYEYELTKGLNPFGPPPTPKAAVGGVLPRSAIPNFDFCGMAVDPSDNLYLVDLFDPTGYKLLRFDSKGNITVRVPLGAKTQPSNSCLAADSDFVYLSSVVGTKSGQVDVFDHNGQKIRQVDLPFLPIAISANNRPAEEGKTGKELMIFGGGRLHRASISRDASTVTDLPAISDQYQVPMLLLHNGDVLLADHQTLKLGRFDANTGRLLTTLGKPGTLPGEFGDIGGLAEDSMGRIYVSDLLNRAIQRFNPDGNVSAVWWAQTLNGESEYESEGR